MPLSRIAPYWAGLGVTQIVVMFDAPRHLQLQDRTHQLDQLSGCQQEERRGLAQACDSGHYQSALQIVVSNFDINVHRYSQYALASL